MLNMSLVKHSATAIFPKQQYFSGRRQDVFKIDKFLLEVCFI